MPPNSHGNATVKAVKVADGDVSAYAEATFNSAAAYANELITDNDVFFVKVTAQDKTTIKWYKIAVTVSSVPLTNATLNPTATVVKGVAVGTFGSEAGTFAAPVLATVEIYTNAAADTDGDPATTFTANDAGGATVKAVKVADGDVSAYAENTFDSANEYANEAITNGDVFFVKVTAEDATTTLWYKITVTVSDQPITGVQITSVTAPVTNESPDTNIDAGTGYTGTVSWADSTGASQTVNFAANTVYIATITLTPANGYTFTGFDGSFTVTGVDVNKSDTVNDIAFTDGLNQAASGDDWVIKAIFPATAKTVVTAIQITSVTAPVTGASPNTSGITGTGYTGTVSWADSAGASQTVNFAANTVYIATITLSPATNYTFDGFSGTLTVAGVNTAKNDGGFTAGLKKTPGTDGGLIVNAIFPATAAVVSDGQQIAGVTVPVTDETPVSDATDGTGYTVTSVTWTTDSGTSESAKFAPATAYIATITLAPATDYTFDTFSGAFSVTGIDTNVNGDKNGITFTSGLSQAASGSGWVVNAIFPATETFAEILATALGGSTYANASGNTVTLAQSTTVDGNLTVPGGVELETGSYALTVDAGVTLTVKGTVTITQPSGSLVLTGAASTGGAKISGAGEIVAAQTKITGEWQAVDTGSDKITIAATSADASSITAGSTAVFTAGPGGTITQKEGANNNLTIAANTTIALGGSTAKVGEIVLTGDNSNPGKLTLTNDTSIISTGNSAGSAAAAPLSTDGTTTVSDASGYTSIGVVDLVGDGANAKVVPTNAPADASTSAAGNIAKLLGTSGSSGTISGGATGSDGSISGATATAADAS